MADLPDWLSSLIMTYPFYVEANDDDEDDGFDPDGDDVDDDTGLDELLINKIS